MESITNIKLDELNCSALYLREKSVNSIMRAYRDGKARNIPPIKVYYCPGLEGVILDGNARAYAARLIGCKTIAAEIITEEAEVRENVVNKVRDALAHGIRSVMDYTPYNLLDESSWLRIS